MIGKTISHYKILEKIGEGGMGVVYKAQDTKLDRTVALKFLPEHSFSDEEARSRFVHEARAASAMDHPNISTVYDIDEADGKTFISMAYIDGKSLKEIAAAGDLSIQEIVKIGVQAGEGLGAAHKKGIVHRDVKSDNLMITGDGHVKVMDFGLAKLKGATGLTRAGQTVGTAFYMSPEQTKGEEVDSRSDVFSLGVVLYELISGRLPFTGEYDTAIAYSIVNEQPKPLREIRPDVPAQLEAIVMKALEKDPANRYQSMDGLVGDLRDLWEGRTSEIRAAVPSERSRMRFVVPAAALVVLAAILLMMKLLPGDRGVPEGAGNTLAVMYFDNMTDPVDTGRLGEIMTNLLITDLSDSRFINVVSSQRLYDILKNMGREGVKAIDRSVASQVARKAKARWMLVGNIVQTTPYLMVTTHLVDVSSGNVINSQQVAGAQGEEVFAVVDRLTVKVKKDLALPQEALEEPDTPVAEITTSSAEAYRHYIEGVDYMNKAYMPEAEASFSKAIAIDSTFAMAYIRLGMAMISNGKAEGLRMADKAVQYADHVTKREQLFIIGLQALWNGDFERGIAFLRRIVAQNPDDKEVYFWLGAVYHSNRDYASAIPVLRRAVEIDPAYKNPYNMLAYCYDAIGDFDNSIWAIDKYISLAPNEANPYDTRGELYARGGRIDEAIASYEKALEIKPDFNPSLQALGLLWIQKRDYEKARLYFDRLASSGDRSTRILGMSSLPLIPLYRGKLDRGLEKINDAIAADTTGGREDLTTAALLRFKSIVLRDKGDLGGALREVQAAMELLERLAPNVPIHYEDVCGSILALMGETDRAEEVAGDLREAILSSDQGRMSDYWRLMAQIEDSRGDVERAVEYMERSNEESSGQSFSTRFDLGRLYLEAGRLGDAVGVLEKCLGKYDQSRTTNPFKSVELHYFLGRAYEDSGWDDKAVSQYEEFLDIWSEADPGVPYVEDAKARLARLKGSVSSTSGS
jgi:tetratricopeptide (TPR) repeat protein/predicted Ser/Thr protein kinase